MPIRGDKSKLASLASIEPDGPFRIATVSERTGVPEPTLRAWERRYGVPSPARTSSGYRLYELSALDEVRSMQTLCDQGMAAAEAAQVIRSRRAPASSKLQDAPAGDARLHDGYDSTIESILDAIERFDDDALENEMRRLPLLGGVLTIVDRILTPVLHSVGERWHAGDLSVAQERLASQRICTFLREVLRSTSNNDSNTRVLLTCFADDEHELGLLVTSIRLAVWGARPIYLGGRMPPSALRWAIQATSPQLVAFSVTIEPPRGRARELIEEYGATCRGIPWIVGGAAAEGLKGLIERFGGQVIADDSEALKQFVVHLRSDDKSSEHLIGRERRRIKK